MRKYEDAVHAMQSGVAMMKNCNSNETDPKHLRVGINSAMCDSASLARLLIKKGVISEDEYIQSITEEMNNEVKRYEDRLSKMWNTKIELT